MRLLGQRLCTFHIFDTLLLNYCQKSYTSFCLCEYSFSPKSCHPKYGSLFIFVNVVGKKLYLIYYLNDVFSCVFRDTCMVFVSVPWYSHICPHLAPSSPSSLGLSPWFLPPQGSFSAHFSFLSSTCSSPRSFQIQPSLPRTLLWPCISTRCTRHWGFGCEQDRASAHVGLALQRGKTDHE